MLFFLLLQSKPSVSQSISWVGMELSESNILKHFCLYVQGQSASWKRAVQLPYKNRRNTLTTWLDFVSPSPPTQAAGSAISERGQQFCF